MPGEFGEIFRIPLDDFAFAHPSPAGGVLTVDQFGLVQVYDQDGELVSTIETGLESGDSSPMSLATDPTANRLVIGGNGVVIVDLDSGQVERVSHVNQVISLSLARGGEILVMGGLDGTVRLWDIERSESLGLAWRGAVGAQSAFSEVDQSLGATWFATAGELIKIPLSPNRWIERASEIASRDPTREEWDRYIPGGDDVQSACR